MTLAGFAAQNKQERTNLGRPFPRTRLDLPILIALMLFLFQNQLKFFEATCFQISRMQATGQKLPQMF